MKYLTTLEVARQLAVSKQTLLNWLYAGRVPEPPRNKKGYRLWSVSRVAMVKKLIGEGRLHKRTVLFREAAARPEIVTEYAREVSQFLRENEMNAQAWLKELARLNPDVAEALAPVPRTAKLEGRKGGTTRVPVEEPPRRQRLKAPGESPD